MKKILIVSLMILMLLSIAIVGACGPTSNNTNNEPTECVHNWSDYQVVTPATCETDGEETRTCSKCNKIESKTITKLNHNYGTPTYTWSADNTTCTAKKICQNDPSHVVEETVTATKNVTQAQSCENDEISTLTVTFTKDGFSAQTKTNIKTADKLGHNYTFSKIEWTDYTAKAIYVCANDSNHTQEYACTVTNKVTIVATCVAKGEKTYTATYDEHSATKTEEIAIDKNNHSLVHHDAKDATCTEIGWNAYDTCENCDYTTYIEIPMLNHNYGTPTYTWSADNTTCTAKKICQNDPSHVVEETVTATKNVTQAQSCENDEISTLTVTFTKDGFSTQTKTNIKTADKLDHNYTFSKIEWTDYTAKAIYVCANDSTHTQEYTCTVTNKVTIVATCVAKGEKTYTATYGEHSATKAEEIAIDKNNHSLVHHDAKDATCTEIGWNAYDTCENCDYTTYVEIPALDHDWSTEWTIDVAATKESTGSKSHHCTRCDAKTDITEIEKLPNISEGLAYTLNSDNVSYSVTGIGTCTDTDIIVPSTYNSLPVTAIGDSAFSESSSLTSVTIPNSVTSIGYRAFYNCSKLQYNEYDNAYYLGNESNKYLVLVKAKNTSITSCTINENCKIIHSEAFLSHSNLTSVTLSNSVTSIGYRAFYNCSKLQYNECDNAYYLGNESNKYLVLVKAKSTSITSCTINENCKFIHSEAFQSRSNLTSITIGSSVTTIGDYAFFLCAALTTIEIPNNVTTIGSYAFSSCKGLTSITIGSSVTTIGDKAFSECSSLTSITIPNSVTSIGSYAFSSCKGLTSITIPNSVTTIGDHAFDTCIAATSITIGNGVTTIGDLAFSGCNSLTSIEVDENNKNYQDIDGNLYTKGGKTLLLYTAGKSDTSFTIPEGVINIENSAFYCCRKLTNIEIPDSVTSIGNSAFGYCSGLISVTIPNSVTSIGKYAFTYCTSLTNITLQSSLTSINNNAFSGCTSLTSITIPNSVTSIGDYAFESCRSLTSITIPTNVTSIGNYAFYGCSKLTYITIPTNVTSIGNYAFYGCSSLTRVTFSDTTTWYVTTSSTNWQNKTSGTKVTVTNTSTNATYIKTKYYNYYWYKI